MDNNDMNNLIRKAQDMINNDQIPAELKSIVSQVSSNNNVNESSSSNNVSSVFSSEETSSTIDVKKLSRLVSSINNNTESDDMSQLLNSLKPYLRNEKREKIDEYIKLIKIGKAAQLFDIISGDNK